jgi:hypothetical protein
MTKAELLQNINDRPYVGWVDPNPAPLPTGDMPDGSVYYQVNFREESNKASKGRSVNIVVIDEGEASEKAFFVGGELQYELPNDDFKEFVSANYMTNPLAQFHGLVDYEWHLYYPYKRTGVIIGQCKSAGWDEANPATMILTLKGFSVADAGGQLIMLPHDVSSEEVAKFSKSKV